MAELGRNFETESLGHNRYSTAISVKPVNHYRDGVWRRIGNVLGNTGDPHFPTGVDELCQFRLDTRIAGKSPLFYFGKGQSRVTLALLDANNVSGVVSGNSVTFPEAWDNADLMLTMAGHRLQKDIFLKAGHPSQFQFRINSHAGFDPETLIFGNDFRILQPVLHALGGIDDILLQWDVTQQGGKYILTVILPEGDFAGWTLDPTLTLQPGAAAGIDNYIRSDAPGANYGTITAFYVGERNDKPNSIRRTLIKFDLSALPDNAVISSAILSLYAIVDFSSNARTFRVYRQKRVWVEAQSTWIIYSTGNNWQTAGGFSANDCEQTDIGNRDFTAVEALNEFKDFPLTPTTKATLDLGNGWLIKADTEVNDGYLFSSSDHATAANRSKLVVEYSIAAGDALLQRPFSPVFRGVFG